MPTKKIIFSKKAAIRNLLFAAGFVSLSLGILGLFLPLLPTTPFLLLASICFYRSSLKMHKWMLTNKLFGRQFSDYVRYRSVPLKTKISTIVLLWIVIIFSIIKFSNIYIQLLLFCIAAAVTTHIFKLRTTSPERATADFNNSELNYLQIKKQGNSNERI